MFMDGLLYACVSKNLADGNASFWLPKLTDTLYASFHEHPPLFFGLQSLFFMALGDSIYTERIFDFVLFIITIFLVAKIWISHFNNKTDKALSWIPLIAFITIPLVSWAFANNMLECLVLIFSLLAIYFINKTDNKKYLYLFLAALSIVAGFLTKGPVALFPLAAIFFQYLVFRKSNFGRMLLDSLFLVFTTAIIFASIYFLIPQAESAINSYIQRQVIGSLSNIQTVDNRLYILGRIFMELSPLLLASALIILISIRKKIAWKENYKKSFYYLLIGLSASMPIMVSMKQSGFYAVPAFPFLVLALSFLISPFIHHYYLKWETKKPWFKTLKILSILLFLAALISTAYFINKPLRDKHKIEDVHAITQEIENNNSLFIEDGLYSDWSLHGYFYRYHSISLHTVDAQSGDFYIQDKTSEADSTYVLVNTNFHSYNLYQKK
jgi:4-amino-4-deoxy-L-arabinose transferase-like glycosyltransferase